MYQIPLNKEAFLQQYILIRSSHKREPKDLFEEAIEAWKFIQNNS
jgi:hypothetical protein